METKLYVARNKDNSLYLYLDEKPRKSNDTGTWIISNLVNCRKLNKNEFPNVKWNDEEPLQVMLIQKVYK